MSEPSFTTQRTFSVVPGRIPSPFVDLSPGLNVSANPVSAETMLRPRSHPPHDGQSPARLWERARKRTAVTAKVDLIMMGADGEERTGATGSTRRGRNGLQLSFAGELIRVGNFA